MRELWRDVLGFESFYKASNTGFIKSLKRTVVYKDSRCRDLPEIILSATKVKGYLSVMLCRDGKKHRKYVHRIIAETWKKNYRNYPEVNHNDFCITNNSTKNLEWCTHKQNMHHSSINNRNRKGEKSHFAKITKKEVIEIRKDKRTLIQIATDYNLSFQNISLIKNRKRWRHLN